ncbi:hypothetical protein CSCA_5205 [Clostridium scatologenes]|uniref:Uncharacterized protein n=1 Tax=Clostridium scatologenes TaxID=1548 RepID=A0A0E3K5I7_CLOSL|nr:hypothetical protein CSCA_5205 [Clostridium scatologenes]
MSTKAVISMKKSSFIRIHTLLTISTIIIFTLAAVKFIN